MPSGDDVRVSASFIGVSGDCFVGDEVAIALDGKAELAAYAGDFDEAHVAEFRLAHAQIAESKGETVIGIELLGSLPGPRPSGQPKGCSKRLLPF